MQEPNSGVIVLAGRHHYYVVPSNGLMYIYFFSSSFTRVVFRSPPARHPSPTMRSGFLEVAPLGLSTRLRCGQLPPCGWAMMGADGANFFHPFFSLDLNEVVETGESVAIKKVFQV